MDNRVKSNRQFATALARKFLGGKISLKQLEDDYPDTSSDEMLTALLEQLQSKPKKKWFPVVKQKTQEKYIQDTLELIDKIELSS